MKSSQKGNSVLFIIILVAVLGAAGIFALKHRSNEAGVSTQENTTETSNGQQGVQHMSGSVSTDAALTNVDANLSAMDKDAADIDSSMNDKPIPQEQ